MTSEERREARYRRRRAAREEKRESHRELLEFRQVFTTSHLYESSRKCTRGVKWKASTQKHMDNAPLHVHLAKKRLYDGTFRSDPFYEFDLYERGKHRHIRSVTIDTRMV